MSIERRRRAPVFRLLRMLTACVVDTETNTILRMVLSYQVCLVGVLCLRNTQIIATPPPIFDGYFLRLPHLAWSGLILIGVLLQAIYWREANICRRRNAGLFSSVVMLLLCSAMMPRGTGLATLSFLVSIWQIIASGKLWDMCRDECSD